MFKKMLKFNFLTAGSFEWITIFRIDKLIQSMSKSINYTTTSSHMYQTQYQSRR